MKIIFLDIDGVLNSERWYTSGKSIALDYYQKHFDPHAIELLNQLIMLTDAEIVLISSWRLDKDISHKLKSVGILSNLYGVTPNLRYQYSTYASRGGEIKLYLKSHPEVTDYVILDDDNDMLVDQQNHFIHIDNKYGLTREDCYKALNILNGNLPSL